ncbi:MAG: citrate transporter [Clostridiales bacterium]|nr:citrate transporter [Clostridiales bacterium]
MTVPPITSVHAIYLVGVIAVLVVMILRKEAILPAVLATFLIGLLGSGNLDFIAAITSVFSTAYNGAKSFLDIIITITLVTALSKVLSAIGADRVMMMPGAKIIKNPTSAYWIVGIMMLVASYFLWPSPAVALIGAMLLPIAVRSGLPAIGVAMAMNIFGHGIALSSDFVIQGSPSISATAVGGGVTAADISKAGIPLYITMAVVTTVAAYFMIRNKIGFSKPVAVKSDETIIIKKPSKLATAIAIITPLAFAANIAAMLVFDLKGGDGMAMVSGTAAILLCAASICAYKEECFDKAASFVREGFVFGIEIFSSVIVIGGFFFLGGGDLAGILGDKFAGITQSGILADWALNLSSVVSLSKVPVVFVQMVCSVLTGLDGSGFSGIPLSGAMAKLFGSALNLNVNTLAAWGQLVTVWVGGGVIVPWAVIPAAAICGVQPVELVRRNLIPVLIGFGATFIVACLLV